ncbi:MAG TPA: sugar porter family MFS transporter, partial [Chloroflexota bacterium]|nr:sugar porter family MFS transporter [Chloroflexota bacterium]
MSSAELRHEDKSRRSFYLAAVVVALGGVLFGYGTAGLSGAILFMSRVFRLSANGVQVVTSLVIIGGILGSAVAGWMGDRYGRRTSLILGAGIFALGSLVTALSGSIVWIGIGRWITGVGVGITSVNTPLYLSEMAPPDLRGSVVSFNQIALTLGILGAYLVGYALSGTGDWRWMIGVGAGPAVILGIGMVFLPESVRWLVKHGELSRARAALSRFRPSAEVEDELADIQMTMQHHADSLSQLWCPALRIPLVIGVGLAVWQQVTGINAVIFYAPMILESVGLASAGKALLASSIVGIINVLATVAAAWLLDRVGRRPLLLVGLAGMAVGMAILILGFRWLGIASFSKPIALGGLVLYVISFAIGLGPVFWLLISSRLRPLVSGTRKYEKTQAAAHRTPYIRNVAGRPTD